MPKVTACLVLKTAKVFTWLGHMPIMTWGISQLQEVRGIEQIMCVAEPTLLAQATKLLAKSGIEVVALPRELITAKESVFDNWLSSANGPAGDAEVIIVTKATSPFMPAAKIESCLTQVLRGKCSTCLPVRATSVLTISTYKRSTNQEAIDGFRVFRVNVPQEKASFKTVRVNLMESLDVDKQDEFVMASALVDSDKV